MIDKKIRILTFHSAYSYGAVLQTFGLWAFLSERFSDVKVINFRPKLFSLRLQWNSPKSWIKNWRFRFRNKISLTKEYSADQLRNNPPDADVIIVGSDQVWNPNITKQYADIYYGDFVSQYIKKISFASSFGIDEFNSSQLIDAQKFFHGFDALSVREESGIGLCKRINEDYNATCVVDPTFLIEDYSKYFRLREEKNDLCLFVLDNNSFECFRLARTVSNALNLKPKILNKNYPLKGFKIIPTPSIPRFVKEIYSSKFVITNSFHGLAFSIIFKKQFIFVCTNKELSSRPKNLLKKLGLSHRLVVSYDEAYDPKLLSETIDYRIVDAKLSAWRRDSIKYLLNNINAPSTNVNCLINNGAPK